jgi:hypothetical protein
MSVVYRCIFYIRMLQYPSATRRPYLGVTVFLYFGYITLFLFINRDTYIYIYIYMFFVVDIVCFLL